MFNEMTFVLLARKLYGGRGMLQYAENIVDAEDLLIFSV